MEQSKVNLPLIVTLCEIYDRPNDVINESTQLLNVIRWLNLQRNFFHAPVASILTQKLS